MSTYVRDVLTKKLVTPSSYLSRALRAHEAKRDSAMTSQAATSDFLPPHAVACALELVGAVRDKHPNHVAHALRSAAKVDGLEALAVTLAAMVDDTRTVEQLLAWTTDQDVMAWRRSLTDKVCADYRNAYLRGYRTQDVLDGMREFDRRRAARKRKKASEQLRSVA